jgi:hypothetical protein
MEQKLPLILNKKLKKKVLPEEVLQRHLSVWFAASVASSLVLEQSSSALPVNND